MNIFPRTAALGEVLLYIDETTAESRCKIGKPFRCVGSSLRSRVASLSPLRLRTRCQCSDSFCRAGGLIGDIQNAPTITVDANVCRGDTGPTHGSANRHQHSAQAKDPFPDVPPHKEFRINDFFL